MAASFHDLNARLEEQQRQQRERRSMNGAASNLQEEMADESVTRDRGNVVTDKRSPEHGHK